MAFDVQPEDVIETEDFVVARFQTPTVPLTTPAKTLAQVTLGQAQMSFAGGPANYLMPRFNDGKYVGIKAVFTPVVAFANNPALVVGPPFVTTYAKYLGYDATNLGASFLFDGVDRKPEVSVRHEEILVPKPNISVIELTSVNVFYSLSAADIWMPVDNAATQIFTPNPVGAVHQIFCSLHLFVKIYYK